MSTTPDRTTDSSNFGRLDSLDGLRTVAILIVFVYHTRPELARGGNYGVDVFFVLSGFVITLLLLKEWRNKGRIDLARFYVHRLLRLWPALIVVSATVECSALVFPTGPQSENPWAPLAAVFYVENIGRAFDLWGLKSDVSLGHTWSLGVEEQFYLVWPLLFLLLVRLWRLRGAAVAALILSAIPTIIRNAVWDSGKGADRIFNMPDTRADQLLIGCAIALGLSAGCLSSKRLLKVVSWATIPASIALLIASVSVDEYHTRQGAAGYTIYVIGPLAVALVAAFLILGLVTAPANPLSKLLAARWLAWPGRNLSYGFYLWHYPIVMTLSYMRVPTALRLLLGLVLTISAAIISAYLVERPIRRLGRSLLGRQRRETEFTGA